MAASVQRNATSVVSFYCSGKAFGTSREGYAHRSFMRIENEVFFSGPGQ